MHRLLEKKNGMASLSHASASLPMRFVTPKPTWDKKLKKADSCGVRRFTAALFFTLERGEKKDQSGGKAPHSTKKGGIT
jgi:hypothetical protein